MSESVGEKVFVQPCETPLGKIVLEATAAGLTRLQFASTTRHDNHAVLDQAKSELTAYFAGHLTSFTTPLAPQGTDFEQAVWRHLQTIPFGTTTTYAAIAKVLGKPGAARAVGRANARNPIWLIIPCHRVIASTGALCGYAGGVETKQWLLEHEERLSATCRQPNLFTRSASRY